MLILEALLLATASTATAARARTPASSGRAASHRPTPPATAPWSAPGSCALLHAEPCSWPPRSTTALDPDVPVQRLFLPNRSIMSSNQHHGDGALRSLVCRRHRAHAPRGAREPCSKRRRPRSQSTVPAATSLPPCCYQRCQLLPELLPLVARTATNCYQLLPTATRTATSCFQPAAKLPRCCQNRRQLLPELLPVATSWYQNWYQLLPACCQAATSCH